MKKSEVKATITIDGKTHKIIISRERAEQIKRLQKLIKANREKQKTQNATTQVNKP